MSSSNGQAPRPRSIAVVGGGFGGVGAAVMLKRAGYEDVTVFEKGERVGGVWNHNTYPGAACDVPSHFYSYSYALNPRWSKTFANQPEILTYLEKVAADNQLDDHLVARSAVTTLRWSDTERRWIGSRNQGVHFLTGCYRFDDQWRKRNTLEIRVRGGEVVVNGFPAGAAAGLWKGWRRTPAAEAAT